MSFRTGSLCSGYDGLAMGIQAVLGGELVFVADNDNGPVKILAHRYPGVPNLGDISKVDWREAGRVDLLCMGFPCKDVSAAGGRAGLRAGNRSGVWTYCAQAIDELRPDLVVIENVRGLLSTGADSPVEPCPWCVGDQRDQPALRALGAVLGDLADLGFDAEWLGLPASDPRNGACHERWREFILAWPATEDADGPAGSERRPAAPGQAESWRAWAHPGGRGGLPLAPTGRLNLLPTPAARDWKSGASNLMEHNSRPLNEVAVNMLAGVQMPGAQWIATDGTDYGPAIRRWEQVTGRPAPCPTEPGDRGNRRLSALFTEWMMGLPAGWVTGVPGLSRDEQLIALGNGCVPRQVALALSLLLERVPAGALAFLDGVNAA